MYKILLWFFAIFFCMLQTTLTQNSQCYDEQGSTACFYWKLSGTCRVVSYRNYMYRICRKTCNLCPSIYVSSYVIPTKKSTLPRKKCRDTRTRCPSWKEFCSEGSEYYKFMQKNCQRTCLTCVDKGCKDKSKKCPQYERFGYCSADHKYFGYMKKSCSKSCKFCKNVQKIEKNKNLKKEFACGFEENECDWSNQYFEDTGDWAVGIDENGPKQGYMNSSKYLSADVSYKGYKTNLWLPWQLVLNDTYTKETNIMCFHFVYQLSHGRLTVRENENPTLLNKLPNPRKIFEAGSKTNGWTQVRVNVQVNERFYLLIIGEKYLRRSYIVVDNFYFTNGKC